MYSGRDTALCLLLVPYQMVLGSQGLTSEFLEPGDISALLQVPNALVVILLWTGAEVATCLQDGLFILSAQSLDCLVVGLRILPGSPCLWNRADTVGSFLKVFNSRIEVITGRQGPLNSSWAGLWCFKRLSWFIPRLPRFIHRWIHGRDLENKGQIKLKSFKLDLPSHLSVTI